MTTEAATDEAATDERVRATYRYVRILVPLPAAWLLLAILVVFLTQGRVLESISDYYGGPLRDVFVGALMASGICMIAYKGQSNLEDYALNFAGVNAFFVALVPNSFQTLLDLTRRAEDEGAPVPVSSVELLQNLKIAVGTFLVVIVVFVLVDYFVMRWTRFRWQDQTRVTRFLLAVSWVTEVVLGLIIVAMWLGWETLFGSSIFTIVHFVAAALLVVNLSFAAASHAFPAQLRRVDENRGVAPGESPFGLTFFRVITALMWVGLALGIITIARRVPYATVTTEVAEILLFLLFWVGATWREWKEAFLLARESRARDR